MSRWIADDETPQVDRAIWLLMGVQKDRAGRVAELLAPFVSSEDPWPRRLSSVIATGEIGSCRGFFNFVLDAVKSGVLDNLIDPTDAYGDAWHLVEPLVKSNPEQACELLAAYIERLMHLGVQKGVTNPFPDRLDRRSTASQVIMEAAQVAPHKYVELLLPVFIQVLTLNADRTGDPPWPDAVWQSGIYGDLSGLDDNFLESLVIALRASAEQTPETFRRYVGILHSLEYATVKNLLVRSYEANGALFADEAIEYLLVHPNNLAAGRRSSHLWVTRKLLESTTPYCSSDNLARLEQAVLDYYPDYELDPTHRNWRGYAQLTLLEGIQASRLSFTGWRRLQELRRKFAGRLPTEPKPLKGGWVGSPIPEDSAKRMSDEDWLGAMRTYSLRSPARTFTDSLIGGALELSRELEKLTKEEPARFANLVHRIPDNVNVVFFEAIVRGITDSGLDPSIIVAACLRCYQLPGRPLGRWITRPLEYVQASELPVEALEMVARYATESNESDVEVKIERPGQMRSHGHDLLTNGINSSRGAAAETIAHVIFDNAEHLAFFEPYLGVMVNDDSLPVRTCVARALLSVLRHDRDLAVELFLQLCEADDELLATHYVELFLHYGTKTHYGQLEPVLRRMVDSELEEVSTAGARQVCLTSLKNDDAIPLAAQCAEGSKAQRLGVAEVYSANLSSSAFRSQCEEMLGKLFSDPDGEVRQAAAECFREFHGQDAREFEGSIETYLQSEAFPQGHDSLMRALERTTADIPELILSTSERYFERVGLAAGDLRTSAALGSTQLAKLVVRAYSSAYDADVKARCLDLIDKMVLLRALGLDDVTAEFER